MKQEGMVHALEGIHHVLAAGGRLIDIHPAPKDPVIQVVQDGKVLFAQPSPDHDHHEEEQAEDALAVVVRQGLFSIERFSEFDFRTYGSSVAEFLDFMAEANGIFEDAPKAEFVTRQEQELYARVEKIIRAAKGGAEFAYLERARITRLVPVRS